MELLEEVYYSAWSHVDWFNISATKSEGGSFHYLDSNEPVELATMRVNREILLMKSDILTNGYLDHLSTSPPEKVFIFDRDLYHEVKDSFFQGKGLKFSQVNLEKCILDGKFFKEFSIENRDLSFLGKN